MRCAALRRSGLKVQVITIRLVTALLLLFVASATAADLRVVSYNVYFDDHSGRTRYPQVIYHLLARDADVIALQEVTPLFYRQLKASELSANYRFSPARPSGGYFNLILSKREPIESGIHRFRSRMGRAAVYADIPHGDQVIRFINVHLESLDTTSSIALRREQTQALGPLLIRHTVLLGDFNYAMDQPFYRQAPHGLVDAAVVHGHESRPTYDIAQNPWAKATAEPDEWSRRLDRFYYTRALRSAGYRVERVFSSDHYPIELTIRPRQDSQ